MGWKQELGRQIRDARHSAGLTQEELGRRLDVSRQMIGRYESGQDAPAVDVLAAVAEALDTEFSVRGIQITFDETSGHRAPRALPKQFQLPFEKAKRFRRAVVEITPRRGRIVIRAEIPA